MILKLIYYGGEEKEVDCNFFEFRTNQVANWILIKKEDGTSERFYNVCVIKTLHEIK